MSKADSTARGSANKVTNPNRPTKEKRKNIVEKQKSSKAALWEGPAKRRKRTLGSRKTGQEGTFKEKFPPTERRRWWTGRLQKKYGRQNWYQMERVRQDDKGREEGRQKTQERPWTKAFHPRTKSTHYPRRKNRFGTVRGVRQVQNNRLWNMQQLSGGRTKGHEGTKPRDWCQCPRSMQGKAEEVHELAGEPYPTTLLLFFMGDIQRS